MAITDITASVLAITGATPTANSVEDAQRFVVSSVPKDLLKWASTLTVPSNHGGNTSDGVKITMPTATDSILDVSRNGFSAIEVPYNMKGFIANSSSLHLATDTYPKYYLDDTNSGEGVRIIVKPIPTDAETAIALYVDFSKVDDDCDLRNAVINYSISKEFTKLATDNLASWDSLVIPSPPSSPSFGSDLTIDVSAPIAPSIDVVTLDNTAWVAPTYVPPVMQSPDWSDVENWITTEEDSEMLNSRVAAIQSQISEYSAKLNESQSNFNKESAIYSTKVNESIQNAQLDSAKDAQDLQKYQSELSEYQNKISIEVQNYVNSFTKNSQEYQSELSLYASELQKYQAEITEGTQEQAIKAQNVQRYEREADRYYSWAKAEIQSYIQNNSKMIQQTMAAQAAAQQQG